MDKNRKANKWLIGTLIALALLLAEFVGIPLEVRDVRADMITPSWRETAAVCT